LSFIALGQPITDWLLRKSACIGWLEREAKEGRLLAKRTLLALVNESGITEFTGIEGRTRPDYGGEDVRQFVGQGPDGAGRAEFGTHTAEEVAQHGFDAIERLRGHAQGRRQPVGQRPSANAGPPQF
jgi:hypothetical protein